MSYVITDPCISNCEAACTKVCPVECIAGPVPLEVLEAMTATERATRVRGVQLYIDASNCIGCGACAPECPVGAIFDEDDVPPEWAAAIARNAAFFGR